MSKYMLLMHPDTHDCYVLKEKEFDTVDEAVKEGMSYGTDDFWVVVKQEWKAVVL